VSALRRARDLAAGLRVGHRVRALRGAAGAVRDPGRLVAGELAMLPLRPVAYGAARLRGGSPGAVWAALTRPLGGQVAVHTLRGSGRRVALRRGTPDIFTLYETHAAGSYVPPPAAAAALDALGRPPRIVDLGANIGLFALYALGRWPGAEVTSFEPDPDNLAILRRNAGASPDARWEVVPAGASTADGTMPFMTGHFAVSRAADAGDAGSTTVPTRDVMPLLAGCDLLKMDIEGGEWPILADPRLADLGAAVVVMEFHAWGAPGGDPAAAARAALEGAGYVVGPVRDEEPGSGTIWAWRTP
jgi:FkbM family methyltransferase